MSGPTPTPPPPPAPSPTATSTPSPALSPPSPTSAPTTDPAAQSAAPPVPPTADPAAGPQPPTPAPGEVSLDTLTLPEGVQLDKTSPFAGEFVGIINDTKLTRAELATKLLDLQSRAHGAMEEALGQQWLEANASWVEAATQIYGGQKGLEAVTGRISNSIEAFSKDLSSKIKANDPSAQVPDFAKDLRTAMTLTGAGNHPVILQYLDFLTTSFAEGSPLIGGAAGAGDRSRAERMFGG